MEAPNGGTVAPDRPARVMLQLGGLRLTGPAAALVLLALLALIAWGIASLHPRFVWSPLWISATLWLAFFIYWGAAAKHAAAAVGAESSASRRVHTLLMQLALVLLFVHVPGLRARWIPAAWPVTALGLAVHAGSFALAAWARGHLGRNWSGAITVKAEHELVRSGPYRLVRHPIYTAMFGMYGGTALVSGELHALLGVALIGVAYARKIPLEEENLRRIFGARYDDYRHASWALIPWVV